MSSAVRDQIASLIDQLFGVPQDALADDVSLADGLQLDSLSVVELQMAIEDHFDVRLDEAQPDADADADADELAEIETYGQLVAVVQRAVDAADDGQAGDEARSA